MKLYKKKFSFSETNSSDSTSPSHHHRRSFRRSRSISWSSVADTPTKNVEQKVMSKQTVEYGNIVDVSEVDEADLKVSKKSDRGSFDRNSLDRNCVLSLDQNFDNQLTKFFDTLHLIESFNNDFGQTPKFWQLIQCTVG